MEVAENQISKTGKMHAILRYRGSVNCGQRLSNGGKSEMKSSENPKSQRIKMKK